MTNIFKIYPPMSKMKLIIIITVGIVKFKDNVLMNPEQLQQMILWLRQQIVAMCSSMNEARKANNYVKEAQYEGMRDAFMRCLNKLVYIAEENVLMTVVDKTSKKQI